MNETNGKNSGRQRSAISREQLITVDDLETFKNDLFHKIEELLNVPTLPGKKWLKSLEVRKLLSISPGTLQNLRVNGTLPFTKIGGTVYYDYDDIQKVLANNKIQSRV